MASYVHAQPFEGGLNVSQLEYLMAESAENLTAYSYSTNSETAADYANSSLSGDVTVVSKSQGAIDFSNNAARSSMFLETIPSVGASNVNLLEIYLVNGSEYTDWNGNWTSAPVANLTQAMKAHNEILGQINLINMSHLEMAGIEQIEGRDAYVLKGSPDMQLYKTFLGLTLASAYSNSPISLPEEIFRTSWNVSSTDLENYSRVNMTIWVDKDTHLLKRDLIQTRILATPEILNLSGVEDFRIEAQTVENSTFGDFNSPEIIALPDGAAEASPLVLGLVNGSTPGCPICQQNG
jgi:hypothetical protein